MKLFQKFVAALSLLFLFAPLTLAETAPRTLNYQGVIFDDAGAPITTPLTLRFSLWKGPDFRAGEGMSGNADFAGFSEIQTITPDGSGNFVTSIGIVDPLPTIDPEVHRYLQVEVKNPTDPDTSFHILDVDGDPENSVDRRFLGATPYALFAETLEGRGLGNEAGEIPFLDEDAKLSSEMMPDLDAEKIAIALEDFESKNLVEALLGLKQLILDNQQAAKNNRNSAATAIQKIDSLTADEVALANDEFESENVNDALIWLKNTLGGIVDRFDATSEKIVTKEIQLGSDDVLIGNADTLNPDGSANNGLLIRSNQTVEVNINGNDNPPDMFVVTSGADRREVFRVEDDGKVVSGNLQLPIDGGASDEFLTSADGAAKWAKPTAAGVTLSSDEFESENVRDALLWVKSTLGEVAEKVALISEKAAVDVKLFSDKFTEENVRAALESLKDLSARFAIDGDGNVDFGRLEAGAGVLAGEARIGNHNVPGYFSVGHRDADTTRAWALGAGREGDTYLNFAAGKSLTFQADNGADSTLAEKGRDLARFTENEFDFNPNQADIDFRVETAANENSLVVDGESGVVSLSGLEFPTADGAAGQLLATDGSGKIGWQDFPENQTAADVALVSDEFASKNVAAALEGLKQMILEDRAVIAELEAKVVALGGELDETSEVPAGTISTFNRSDCPDGWSEVFGNLFGNGNGNGWFNGQSWRSIVICQKD